MRRAHPCIRTGAAGAIIGVAPLAPATTAATDEWLSRRSTTLGFELETPARCDTASPRCGNSFNGWKHPAMDRWDKREPSVELTLEPRDGDPAPDRGDRLLRVYFQPNAAALRDERVGSSLGTAARPPTPSRSDRGPVGVRVATAAGSPGVKLIVGAASQRVTCQFVMVSDDGPAAAVWVSARPGERADPEHLADEVARSVVFEARADSGEPAP